MEGLQSTSVYGNEARRTHNRRNVASLDGRARHLKQYDVNMIGNTLLGLMAVLVTGNNTGVALGVKGIVRLC